MVAAARAKGQVVGYRRVSSVDQNEARQLDGVSVDKVFVDKASGKDTKRPQLQRALEFLREGDVLVVHSMDRLARNLDDLRKMVRELTGRGVRVQFVKEGLTFNGDDSPMSTFMMNMLGSVAEFERSLIRERQREGIAIAKAKTGKDKVYLGRKPSLSPERATELRSRLAAEKVNKADLAREFGISRAALYVYAGRA
jgi:DNA invertase Pin-like site-specific DNA recombinase